MVEEVGVNSERESGDSGRVNGGGGRRGTVGRRWLGIGSLLSALDMPCYCLLDTNLQKQKLSHEFSECNA